MPELISLLGIKSAGQQLPYCEELLESIDDALITTDKDFRITHWNKAAERIYNITAEKALGSNIRDIVTYDFLGTTNEKAVAHLQTFNKWKGVVKYTKDDLTELYLQSSVSLVKNESGEATGIIALNRDVTQQYMAEQSLANFTAILAFLDESFLIFDKNLIVVFENQKQNLRDLYHSDYKKGDHLIKYLPESLHESVTKKYQRALAGESFSTEVESEGEPEAKVYMHITYMPVRNAYNIVTHAAVIIKDLTEAKRLAIAERKQKEAQALLDESRVLFEEFMDNCPMPAWITDENGVRHYMNPKYLETTNITTESMGKKLDYMFTKEMAESYAEKNRSVLNCNKAMETMEHLMLPDGNKATFLTTRFPILYKGKQMVAGWATNVTEQIKIQLELQETNDYKDKILSVIGHDLRSPLSVVSSLSWLVAEEADHLSKDEMVKYFSHVKISNDKAMQLLQELLVWAQSHNNRVSCEPKLTDVPSIIRSSVSFLQEQLDKKSIKVSFNLQPNAIAFADENMLRTVVRNLLSNAIKFSPDFSTITVSALLETNEIKVCVADEGIGIEEGMKNKILAGKNAASTYGTNGETGTGIGLSICKAFIVSNKGELNIDNNSGKGTVFSFGVPKFDFAADVAVAKPGSEVAV